MPEIVPDKKTLGDLLSSTLLVRDWQRNYGWIADEWTAFWTDSKSYDEQRPNSTTDFDFICTIILVDGTHHDRSEVLNGQQRLATSTILIVAIRDELLEGSEAARNTAQDLQSDFVFRGRSYDEGLRSPNLTPNLHDHDFLRNRLAPCPANLQLSAGPAVTGSPFSSSRNQLEALVEDGPSKMIPCC